MPSEKSSYGLMHITYINFQRDSSQMERQASLAMVEACLNICDSTFSRKLSRANFYMDVGSIVMFRTILKVFRLSEAGNIV